MISSDPTESITLHEYDDGFVDDTYLFCNAIENLRNTLQCDAQKWESLLFAAGGKLELSKCFYYQMEWKFDKEGKAHIKTLEELEEGPLRITDSETKQRHIIKSYNCNQPHKTLGVWLALDGNNKKQKERRRKEGASLYSFF